MNLKAKLTNKITATVRIISGTQAIYSDECSPTHINTLSIITASTKQDLWNAIKDRARTDAANAKFRCIIALIDTEDKLTYLKDEVPTTNLNDYGV